MFLNCLVYPHVTHFFIFLISDESEADFETGIKTEVDLEIEIEIKIEN